MKSWIYQIRGIYHSINSVSISQDGRYLAIGGEDKVVYYWSFSELNNTIFNGIHSDGEESFEAQNWEIENNEDFRREKRKVEINNNSFI